LLEKTWIPSFILGCIKCATVTISPFLFIFLFAVVLGLTWFAVLVISDFSWIPASTVEIDIYIPAAAVIAAVVAGDREVTMDSVVSRGGQQQQWQQQMDKPWWHL
jgi:hypothetical protein